MAEKIAAKRTSYNGHRHVTLILSDYYGRGIVRSNQESTNLRAYSRTDEVIAAEAIKTNKNVMMPAAGALKLVERMNGCTGADCLNEAQKTRMEFDDRDKRNIRIVYPRILHNCMRFAQWKTVDFQNSLIYPCMISSVIGVSN